MFWFGWVWGRSRHQLRICEKQTISLMTPGDGHTTGHRAEDALIGVSSVSHNQLSNYEVAVKFTCKSSIHVRQCISECVPARDAFLTSMTACGRNYANCICDFKRSTDRGRQAANHLN